MALEPVSLSCGVTFEEEGREFEPTPLSGMFYDFAVVVPAGTTQSSPKEQTLKLEKGIIHRVEIERPTGCKGYVFLALMHGGHQAFPKIPSEAFTGQGPPIVIDDHYPLTSPPYSLKAVAWSPEAIYDHTWSVRIGILSEDVLSPLTGLGAMFKKFFKLIGLGG